jgi:hypothetical protein
MVVIEGNDPSWQAYETRAYPSRLYHQIGIPGGTRTPTNSFGDYCAAITPPRYILEPPEGLEPPTFGFEDRHSIPTELRRHYTTGLF